MKVFVFRPRPRPRLAKRIEGLALPDRIYLSEHTAALVASGLQLTDRGAFDVRGAGAPVRVFELA